MNSGDPIIEKLVDDDEPHLSSELFRSIFLPGGYSTLADAVFRDAVDSGL
jgi:hypothetical protein